MLVVRNEGGYDNLIFVLNDLLSSILIYLILRQLIIFKIHMNNVSNRECTTVARIERTFHMYFLLHLVQARRHIEL